MPADGNIVNLKEVISMKRIHRGVLSLCCVFLLSGCAAQKSLVVLLPNPDGKTGTIEVSNGGGARTIYEANKAVKIESPTLAPAPPVAISEAEISAIFGDALNAQPHAPTHVLLHFKSDSVELTDESQRELELVCVKLESITPVEVTVVGHTDRVGSREKNFRLGLERASQIRDILVAKGVDRQIIDISSHGEDNPLFKTEDEVSNPENRRVEIVIR